jgi:hypothetical protein
VVSTPEKIFVSWDDYSIYYGKIKTVPNHQPDNIIKINILIPGKSQ